LRREPLAVRKVTFASLLTHLSQGLRFNEHLDTGWPVRLPTRPQDGLRPSCRSGKDSAYFRDTRRSGSKRHAVGRMHGRI
jgi:hypothetical protein